MQGLRNASERPWAKLLMGVLIFSFVGWGAANWILGESSVGGSLVTIGSESVSIRDFEQERNRQIAQMSKEMQKQIYSDRRSQTYFNQQIISNMATRILLEQHAANLGLVVSPAAVANIIKSSPEFWENGSFSTDKFDAVLDMNGISEKDFTNTLMRQELRETMLEVLNTNPGAPDFVINAIYNARNASRKIEYSAVKFDAFTVNGTPTDDNLREVYAKNPKMLPEYRTVSYVISPAKMSDNNSYERGYESARSMEDMLVAGDSMKDAAKKMRGGFRTFAPMTIQRQTANGDYIKDSVFTDEMMKNLFAMDQGLESEIIETKNGFVIFRIEKIDQARAVPLEERKSALVSLWRKSEQEKQAYLRANEILSSGKKLAVSTTVTRTDGAPLEVLNAAFALDFGTSRIVQADDGFYVVKPISGNVPAKDMQKMKSISKEVKSTMTRQILDDYTNFLGRKYSIRPNERLMRKMFNE
jgi:hypothetical protein